MKTRKKYSVLAALVLCLSIVVVGCGSTSKGKVATYQGTAQGYGGDVVVEITVASGTVTDINLISHNESAGISDKAINDILPNILAQQTLNVDTVAGATTSSTALIAATEAAMVAAGIDISIWKNGTSNGNTVAEKKDDVTCDTVVIGAGGAGIKTALELKSGGQNVVLVEKMPFVGGATNLAATYFVAVDTDVQKADGKGMSVKEYVAQQVKTNPDINADNMTKMFSASQESLDWLNDLGAKINRPMSTYQVGTEDGSSLGVGIIKVMSAKMEAEGIDCRLETKALELIVENGKIIGVTVEDAGGLYNIYADNVVIATGGFASSPEAVADFAPDWVGLPSTSAVGSTGDGAYMAQKVGASLKFMDSVRLNPSVYSKDGVNSSLSAARAEGGIMVNLQGKRFCNDYFPNYTQLSRWMMEQEGDHVYIVIDQKSMDASARLQGFLKKGYFLQADTIEELAEKMKVPVDNLVQTIDTYSKAVKSGEDKEFGRTTAMNTALETAPYYAVVTRPGIQVTLGGVEVNENMQVVSTQGAVFDNLYAVGEVAHDGLFGSGPTNINIFWGKVVAMHILNK